MVSQIKKFLVNNAGSGHSEPKIASFIRVNLLSFGPLAVPTPWGQKTQTNISTDESLAYVLRSGRFRHAGQSGTLIEVSCLGR